MARVWISLVLAACSVTAVHAKDAQIDSPGCERKTAKECLNLAIEAIGGRERLEALKNMRLESIGHTLLMEQSYRQEPFITSYERATTTIDFGNHRTLSVATLTWPEADDNQSESTSVVVTGGEGGVRRGKDSDTPCSLADLDAASYALALGPTRILLTAEQAGDLHYEKPELARSTLHSVLGFTWQETPVRVFLNRFNHFPDVVEARREFHDFWFFWGDVLQRLYLDNWKLIQGIHYPTNVVEEHNGAIWRSTQALKVEFNVAISENEFRMDSEAAKRSAASSGWNRPFRTDKTATLASGIDLFLGPWNTTIVKQSDGIVILEAPISERYTQGVVEEAKRRYPGMPIKAVLSTSDSWPHTGGVRFAVSQRLPVYILDLNRPLLDKLIQAPHSIDPDNLERTKPREIPVWEVVSDKREVGSGPNRMELYPLRGAATERQYMVYFPEHDLLYASDTLVLNEDSSLYDPELMSEVAQVVRRRNLRVGKVFAMHQGPTAWNQVLALIEESPHP